MLFSYIHVLALSCVMAHEIAINSDNGDISLNSAASRKLVQNARKAQNAYSYYGNANGQNANGQYEYNGEYSEINWDDIDTDFLSSYSVKFQGCHHVQQWNENFENDADIKIMTQRLVRFRMCPSETCSSSSTRGCDKNYGDYIVDMETYVEAYLNQIQGQYMENNPYYNNRNLADSYYYQQVNDMDLSDYLQCKELSLDENQRRKLGNNNYYSYQNGAANNGDEEATVAYFVGPYCAEQGGEIRLGIFYDDTCTVFADDGAEIFEMAYNGMSLPYSKRSLVSLDCMSCGGYGEVNELCQSLYEVSGKCETKMSVYYPNESACTYLDGIKVIREDGVIRTSASRKSTAAAVATGLFLTAAVLLSGYIYYLRTKLGRARINLAASSQNLR